MVVAETALTMPRRRRP